MSGVSKNERIVSLLIHLAQSERPSSRARIEEAVEGYGGLGSGDESAEKSLERDIHTLRDIGVQVVTDEDGCLSLDSDGAYAREIELDEGSIARLLLISAASLGDPGYVYREELRSALMKLQGSFSYHADSPTLPATSTDAKSMNDAQAAMVKKLEECRERRKVVTFSYEKQDGTSSTRTVEPLGLFSLEEDWYLIGWDRDRDGEREFRIDRMSALRQKSQSASPDFEPHDFRLSDHIHFPFFFGTEPVFDVAFLIPTYTVREPDYLWDDAEYYRIADDEEHLLMVAQARSTAACAQWALAHSPHTVPVYPAAVADAYFAGLLDVMKDADPLAAERDTGDRDCCPTCGEETRADGKEGSGTAIPVPGVPAADDAIAYAAVSEQASRKRPRKSGRPNGTVEASRLLALYTYLEQHGLFSPEADPAEPNRIAIADVAKFFDYTEDETADLASKLACCSADYYLYIPVYVEDGYLYGAPFSGIPRPLRLSVGECKALIAALDVAGVPADNPLRAQLIDGAGTPDFKLGSSFSNYIPDADFAKDATQRSTIDTVLTALVEQKLLRFGYRKLGRERLERRCVEPISLILDKGKWYLCAWCLTRNAVRTFSISNMRYPHVSDDTFTPHVAEPKRFSTTLEKDMPRALLRFGAGTAFERREWPGATVVAGGAAQGESGTANPVPGVPAELVVSVPWSGSDWLPLHVMSRLGQVKVESPAELRERAAALARIQHTESLGTLRAWERVRNGDFVSLDTDRPSPDGVGSLMAALRGTTYRSLS